MSDRPCFVYFVQAGDGGPIKIGISRNVTSRFSKMQTDTPSLLKLLAVVPGSEAKERHLHKALSAHRRTGEWFEPHPDLLAVIASEKAAAGNVEYLVSSARKMRTPKSALQAWRFRKGLTGEQAAQLFGVERTHISHLENGLRFPSFDVLKRIHEATDGEITPNDFAPWLRAKKAEVA